MCRMLLLCAGMVAVVQNMGAARASAAGPESSQISSDCEEALAEWFIVSYGVFAEPAWRALSETPAFAQLADVVRETEQADCLEEAQQDTDTCTTLKLDLDTAAADVRAQPAYRAYAQTEIYQAAQKGLLAVKTGACLADNELFPIEHTLLP